VNRRSFLSASLAAPLTAVESRPNTLFVLVDDLRFNCLSLLGHPFLKTPNLDRIGKEGAVFSNAFVTTPLCSPSRGSFLTGRWAHSHGIIDNTDRAAASHKLVTFPALQRAAGYETAFIGKWHMGNDATPRPGFDHWVCMPGQGRYEDPQLNTNGKMETHKGFNTDVLTDAAVDYLKRSRTKPFSLYLSYKAVHGPFTPPDRHKSLHAGAPIVRHPNANDDYAGKPAFQGGTAQQRGPNDETVRNQLRLLQGVDEGMGRVLDVLQQQGQLDNTLVVFTSDNGYFHGDHGLGDKRAAYDEALRIPMLARFPKWIRAGTKIDADVLNVDIAPTMLEVAGAKMPSDMRGLSMVPLLRGKKVKWREDFLAEYFFEQQFPRVPAWKAVRNRGWKLIRYENKPEWTEMYRLSDDPFEMKNLANDALSAKQRTKMERRLERLLVETA
jgi:N-acetylglucosamine-6-sulfatase